MRITDVAYQEARNRLISRAEPHADQIAGPEPEEERERDRWAAKWTREFHKEMNHLAREAGIC
jgi:hypothetical protein